MYPAIRRYDDQAFHDISEKSGKKKIIVKKSLRPVPIQGIVEQAEQNGELSPQRGNPGCA